MASGRFGQLEAIEPRPAATRRPCKPNPLGIVRLVIGCCMGCFIAIQNHSNALLRQKTEDCNSTITAQMAVIESLQQSLSKAKQSVAFWQMVATQPPTPDIDIPAITCPEEEEVSDDEILALVKEQFGSSEESGPGH